MNHIRKLYVCIRRFDDINGWFLKCVETLFVTAVNVCVQNAVTLPFVGESGNFVELHIYSQSKRFYTAPLFWTTSNRVNQLSHDEQQGDIRHVAGLYDVYCFYIRLQKSFNLSYIGKKRRSK